MRRLASCLAAAGVLGCADAPTNPALEPGAPVCSFAVSLAVGQSVRPIRFDEPCRIKPTPGAEYALAYLDTRSIDWARTGYEGYRGNSWYDDHYRIRLTVMGTEVEQPGQEPQLLLRADSAFGPVSDAVQLVLPRSHEADPSYRRGPWFMHERFEVAYFDGLDSSGAAIAVGTARVVRIFDGRFVAAWFEDGDSARLATFLPQLDSAFDVARTYTLPLLRATFADALPITSAGSRQYLMLLRDTLVLSGRPLLGLATARTSGDSAFTWIFLKVQRYSSSASLAAVLTHEMAHSYQRMYMHASRPRGEPYSTTGAALWGVEGGANLMSYEVTRRVAGIPLDANLDWRQPQPTPAAQLYANRAQPAGGEFMDGYDNSMGFMRDLVLRRMLAGESLDRALLEISRGAIEGWYGFDYYSRRAGLTSRMRQRLGFWWDPAAAVLQWALSHAADDLTPNSLFQDRASLRVWDIPAERTYGWRPDTTLGTLAGGDVVITRRYGSPGFVYLRDDGEGLSFRVRPDWTGTDWRLVRVK